ncbi:hypothetical protein ACLMJK_001921 [Lecanora helva]
MDMHHVDKVLKRKDTANGKVLKKECMDEETFTSKLAELAFQRMHRASGEGRGLRHASTPDDGAIATSACVTTRALRHAVDTVSAAYRVAELISEYSCGYTRYLTLAYSRVLNDPSMGSLTANIRRTASAQLTGTYACVKCLTMAYAGAI